MKSRAHSSVPTRGVLEALPAAGLPYLLARDGVESALVVCADDARAEALEIMLETLGVPDVALFLAGTHTPFEPVSPDPGLAAARFALRHRLLQGQRPRVIVASAASLTLRWMPTAEFVAHTHWYREGDEVARDHLTVHSLRCGYLPVSLVEDEGTFSVRGGIFDIFPFGARRPYRVDLFGDDIASIKTFDPATQRTFERVAELAIHPVREVVFTPQTIARARATLERLGDEQDIPTRKLQALLDEVQNEQYVFGIDALWPAFYDDSEPALPVLQGATSRTVLDDRDAVQEAVRNFVARAGTERERVREQLAPALPVAALLVDAEAAAAAWREQPTLATVALADDRAEVVVPHGLDATDALAKDMAMRRQAPALGEVLEPLVRVIRDTLSVNGRVSLTVHSRAQGERLREMLLGRRVDAPVHERWSWQRRDALQIVVAPLPAGLHDTQANHWVVTEAEIFGATPKLTRKRRHKPTADSLTALRDLQEGDLVVHTDHGIGRYVRLARLVVDGADGDYVTLEYAGGDKLYLPIYRLSLLQRYRGPKGEHVKLDRLGGSRWERAKARVRDDVLALAHKVLALQAQRKLTAGYALPPPDEQYRRFEAEFPYEETPDQQKAIDAVLTDLTAGSPMDRLVCGDVGFGKTEVAMRAAYLAVLAGKQVAVLVPTTVLAEQHGATFRERMKGEAVTVEVLSRFRSPKEIEDIRARVRSGGVDVLVGTHRLLSHDIAFKDLGLLVVDEEHRFGVQHKERIKELQSTVHVLTLTATPIPRTMHMALAGIRDLSIIQTPPTERTPVHTEVTRFDEALLTEAIRNELHRGGQVFFVHNRVQSIGGMVELIQRLVPEARVVMAHGQMTGSALEKIMVSFVRREHDVLVCTAIIESGIDIPSANTMIINRADSFGAAQLHQLRGRIGRGRDRAYAYLLLPRSEQITREAQSRLGVLKRFSDLGAGFHIASHDLDLRGAGDLLGSDQSGHIAAVGFDLYCELLAEAMEHIKGAPSARAQHVEPEIKLSVAAVLPESYVDRPVQRLEYYQRMANAASDDAIGEVLEELRDVYGPLPDEVRNLGEVMVIRRRLLALGASHLGAAVTAGKLKIGVTFLPHAALDRAALAALLQREPNRYALTPSGRLAITRDTKLGDTSPELLREVREELGQLPVGRS